MQQRNLVWYFVCLWLPKNMMKRTVHLSYNYYILVISNNSDTNYSCLIILLIVVSWKGLTWTSKYHTIITADILLFRMMSKMPETQSFPIYACLQTSSILQWRSSLHNKIMPPRFFCPLRYCFNGRTGFCGLLIHRLHRADCSE